MEKYIANAFLPRVQNDYRGRIADALSSPAAFKPRGRTVEVYDRTVEKGRPVLQGGLAAESLVLEVLAWAQALPMFAGQLVGVVQSMLERLLERCRAAYTEVRTGSESSEAIRGFNQSVPVILLGIWGEARHEFGPLYSFALYPHLRSIVDAAGRGRLHFDESRS
jgi:hypothetical protein